MDDPSSSPAMFHTGSLQSGISRAIQENKVVACFVHSPSDHASQIWEDYWLANKSQPTDIISADIPPLGLVLAEKAVLLKLALGSKEAKFLNAFVKVKRAPCLVVIHNGKVLEKVEGNIGKEEFTERLLRAVGFEGAGAVGTRVPEGPPAGLNDDDEEQFLDDIGGRHVVAEQERSVGGGETGTAAGSLPTATVPPSTPVTQPTQPTPPTRPTQPTPPKPPKQSTSDAQAMMAERARKLELERLRREAAEKAERIARANARRKEEEDAAAAAAAAAHPNGKGKQRATSEQKEQSQARDAWVYQQKQRKDEAKKERERILAQIEADKQERKAQQQRRKEIETSAGGGAFSEIPPATTSTTKTPARTSHSSCALQIRLFDGSSIRGKFAPDADIATAVRTWVKEASPEGGADIPFTFRQIRAPQPSRTIEVGEENQSLLELGLAPSATLVLVPVAGATSAYASAGGNGYVGTAYGAASWAASGVFGLLGTAFSYVPGFGSGGGSAASGPYMGGTGDEREGSNVQGARMAGSDTAAPGGATKKVNRLGDRTRRNDDVATFYNGNSSAFEGRKGDDSPAESGK